MAVPSTPRHHARPVHGGLLLVVEVADETDEPAQALDVEGVEVDMVAAAGGPGRLGPEPLDESPLSPASPRVKRGFFIYRCRTGLPRNSNALSTTGRIVRYPDIRPETKWRSVMAPSSLLRRFVSLGSSIFATRPALGSAPSAGSDNSA